MAKNISTFKIRGKVKFANLTTPKSFDPASNTMIEDLIKGAYAVTLTLEKNEINDAMIEGLISECYSLHKAYEQSEAYQSKKDKKELQLPNFSIKDELDQYGNPTGNWELKFKRNAQNREGKPAVIRFYNSVKMPYTPEKEIGMGSDIVVNFSIYDSAIDGKEKRDGKLIDVVNHHCTFCILQVQVIEHKTFDGDNSWMEDDDNNIGEEEFPF